MKKEAFFSKYFLHILLCCLFLCMPLILASPFRSELGLSGSLVLKKIATNALLAAFFYFNYFFLLKFLFVRKYFLFIVLLVFLFGLVLSPGYFFKIGENFAKPGFGPDFEITTFLFIALFFISYSMRMNLRLKDMETEKLNAQFSMLKAQVSPHFLFNTLNSIYALAIKGAPDAASAIVKLSNMLRYTLTEGDKDFVSLSEEISFVENFIALQRYRLGKTCIIEYACVGDDFNHQIIPMVLISFVENAFKYGVSEKQVATIKISILITEKLINLSVTNDKMSTVAKENSTGIGIQNTKKRLDLYYPNTHTLAIQEDSKTFTVSLKITVS